MKYCPKQTVSRYSIHIIIISYKNISWKDKPIERNKEGGKSGYLDDRPLLNPFLLLRRYSKKLIRKANLKFSLWTVNRNCVACCNFVYVNKLRRKPIDIRDIHNKEHQGNILRYKMFFCLANYTQPSCSNILKYGISIIFHNSWHYQTWSLQNNTYCIYFQGSWCDPCHQHYSLQKQISLWCKLPHLVFPWPVIIFERRICSYTPR